MHRLALSLVIALLSASPLHASSGKGWCGFSYTKKFQNDVIRPLISAHLAKSGGSLAMYYLSKVKGADDPFPDGTYVLIFDGPTGSCRERIHVLYSPCRHRAQIPVGLPTDCFMR